MEDLVNQLILAIANKQDVKPLNFPADPTTYNSPASLLERIAATEPVSTVVDTGSIREDDGDEGANFYTSTTGAKQIMESVTGGWCWSQPLHLWDKKHWANVVVPLLTQKPQKDYFHLQAHDVKDQGFFLQE